MASEGQGRASQAPALTSLPRVEDLPTTRDGYDRDKVREAFEAFRRHTTQLQVQLRVLQAAGQSGIEPTGHAVRMDALHLIRAAAEMADTIERDAQSASATQLRRTEEEVTKRQHELQAREGDDAVGRVAESIVGAAEAAAESSRGGPKREPELRAPEAVEDSEPPASPPVSPGPPPPSPEAQSEPEDESDGNDGG